MVPLTAVLVPLSFVASPHVLIDRSQRMSGRRLGTAIPCRRPAVSKKLFGAWFVFSSEGSTRELRGCGDGASDGSISHRLLASAGPARGRRPDTRYLSGSLEVVSSFRARHQLPGMAFQNNVSSSSSCSSKARQGVPSDRDRRS